MAPVSSSLEKSSRPPGSLVVPLPAEQEAGINTQAWGGGPVSWQSRCCDFFQEARVFRCYLSGEGVEDLGYQDSVYQMELS